MFESLKAPKRAKKLQDFHFFNVPYKLHALTIAYGSIGENMLSLIAALHLLVFLFFFYSFLTSISLEAEFLSG